MGLTSSLFAGLSGMKSNEFRMDVIGDNIANVNTYGFKSSRVTFQNQFLNTFSFGSAPTTVMGGSNPMQVGTGAQIGSITRDFAGGAPETTGQKTDLAVLGEGFFIVETPDGSNRYTRDGSFEFNSENYLMTADGYFLQGFAVDNSFNIIDGTLSKLSIPVGEITTATATSNAAFAGNFNSNGDVPTLRPVSTSLALITAVATPATGATALTSLVASDGTTQLFYADNVITLAEANKGGANLPVREFVVGTTGTDVDDFMDWLEDVLGIVDLTEEPDLIDLEDAVPPTTGHAFPGIEIAADGTMVITSNIGSRSNIVLESGAITARQGDGATAPGSTTPFTFTNTIDEDATGMGEGVRTSFRAYDSLGAPVDVIVTLALENKTDGTQWRFFAESGDDTSTDRVLGTGTISFDSLGNYTDGDGLTFQVDRVDTGAQTPQSITLDFSSMKSFAMNTSAISLLTQDGFQSGTLQDFAVGADGIIVGSFTNGLTRSLGQVVLSTFRNYGGLIAQGQNLFRTGANSGDAMIKKPQELGAGALQSGALELSNVDLSREFINLIVSSTGFSASSRVIQTSDQLLSELIALTR